MRSFYLVVVPSVGQLAWGDGEPASERTDAVVVKNAADRRAERLESYCAELGVALELGDLRWAVDVRIKHEGVPSCRRYEEDEDQRLQLCAPAA